MAWQKRVVIKKSVFWHGWNGVVVWIVDWIACKTRMGRGAEIYLYPVDYIVHILLVLFDSSAYFSSLRT
jgi:hypothetical protein